MVDNETDVVSTLVPLAMSLRHCFKSHADGQQTTASMISVFGERVAQAVAELENLKSLAMRESHERALREQKQQRELLQSVVPRALQTLELQLRPATATSRPVPGLHGIGARNRADMLRVRQSLEQMDAMEELGEYQLAHFPSHIHWAGPSAPGVPLSSHLASALLHASSLLQMSSSAPPLQLTLLNLNGVAQWASGSDIEKLVAAFHSSIQHLDLQCRPGDPTVDQELQNHEHGDAMPLGQDCDANLFLDQLKLIALPHFYGTQLQEQKKRTVLHLTTIKTIRRLGSDFATVKSVHRPWASTARRMGKSLLANIPHQTLVNLDFAHDHYTQQSSSPDLSLPSSNDLHPRPVALFYEPHLLGAAGLCRQLLTLDLGHQLSVLSTTALQSLLESCPRLVSLNVLGVSWPEVQQAHVWNVLAWKGAEFSGPDVWSASFHESQHAQWQALHIQVSTDASTSAEHWEAMRHFWQRHGDSLQTLDIGTENQLHVDQMAGDFGDEQHLQPLALHKIRCKSLAFGKRRELARDLLANVSDVHVDHMTARQATWLLPLWASRLVSLTVTELDLSTNFNSSELLGFSARGGNWTAFLGAWTRLAHEATHLHSLAIGRIAWPRRATADWSEMATTVLHGRVARMLDWFQACFTDGMAVQDFMKQVWLGRHPRIEKVNVWTQLRNLQLPTLLNHDLYKRLELVYRLDVQRRETTSALLADANSINSTAFNPRSRTQRQYVRDRVQPWHETQAGSALMHAAKAEGLMLCTLQYSCVADQLQSLTWPLSALSCDSRMLGGTGCLHLTALQMKSIASRNERFRFAQLQTLDLTATSFLDCRAVNDFAGSGGDLFLLPLLLDKRPRVGVFPRLSHLVLSAHSDDQIRGAQAVKTLLAVQRPTMLVTVACHDAVPNARGRPVHLTPERLPLVSRPVARDVQEEVMRQEAGLRSRSMIERQQASGNFDNASFAVTPFYVSQWR